MTPEAVSAQLSTIGPHVWYRGCVEMKPYEGINRDAEDRLQPKDDPYYLHLFVVSEVPHTEPDWFKHKLAMCAFYGNESDEEIPTSLEEVEAMLPDGVARYNGEARGLTTIASNSFYGGYDKIEPKRA